MIFTTGDFGDFGHVVFYDFGNSFVVLVASFAVLEEDVAVFSHATGNGRIGSECAGTKIGKRFLVEKGSEIFLLEGFDFLYFMRSTEAVEEIDERNARFNCREVCHTCKVHHFLNGTFGQHCEASLTDRHHVLMVTEDRKRMRSNCSSRHMENRRKKLTGDFIHVRDHQEEALRSGISCSESSGLERSVNSACGTAFGLHFLHENCFTKNVLSTCCRPFVDIFSHCRRRGDGVNGSHFREHIAHVSGSLITITSQEFFFFTHNRLNSMLYIQNCLFFSLKSIIFGKGTKKSEIIMKKWIKKN